VSIPNTINSDPKLGHLSNFERAQGEQPWLNTLQSPTTRPVVLPEENFLTIVNRPLESIFKIPSPTLQTPNLLQIFPLERDLTIFSVLSQTSLASVFGFKNLLLQAVLVHPQTPNPFP